MVGYFVASSVAPVVNCLNILGLILAVPVLNCLPFAAPNCLHISGSILFEEAVDMSEGVADMSEGVADMSEEAVDMSEVVADMSGEVADIDMIVQQHRKMT